MADLNVPDEAVRAAMRAAVEHFELPFMARVRDFTDEQVQAGELRAADEEADRKNLAAVREVVVAAAPLLVAAELERLVDETDWAWAVGDSLRRRAAALRGEQRS